MLIVMEPKATAEQVDKVVSYIKSKGFDSHISHGEINTVIGAVGGKTIDTRSIELMDGVQDVMKITTNYKLASKVFKPEPTIINVGNIKIGSNELCLIAGPCTVESLEQIEETVSALAKLNIPLIIRGGAFKPRTSPYSFQGLGEEGLKILKTVCEKYNFPIISEIMDISQLPMFLKYSDILQVGARNMQNFNLLKELGQIRKPVMLKRGASATIEEWLMSAEYVMYGGNMEVILCERGIRTFENATRNTLDLSAIPVIKKLSHLPIIVDPSHGTGLRNKVAPMSRAAVAAGADGVMVEVHYSPETALCDGAQSLYPEQYKDLVEDLKIIAPVVGKYIRENN
jgi:3-deoxy-7-phosphoheptulonate synthase